MTHSRMDEQTVHSRPTQSRHLAAITQAAGLPALHPYSCITCRSRKVKCNRVITGCSNCKKTSSQCIYLARRTQKNQKPEQAHALRLLAPTGRHDDTRSSINSEHDPESVASRDDDKKDDDDGDLLIPREVHDSSFQSKFDFGKSNPGRLFVAQGKSRYIDSRKAAQVGAR